MPPPLPPRHVTAITQVVTQSGQRLWAPVLVSGVGVIIGYTPPGDATYPEGALTLTLDPSQVTGTFAALHVTGATALDGTVTMGADAAVTDTLTADSVIAGTLARSPLLQFTDPGAAPSPNAGIVGMGNRSGGLVVVTPGGARYEWHDAAGVVTVGRKTFVDTPADLTTTDATPTVVYSLAIPANTAFNARILVQGHLTDYSNGSRFEYELFGGRAAGNIAGPSAVALTPDVDGISGPCSLAVAHGTTAISATVTGKAATNIVWSVEAHVRYF